ncbi:hypothetical protein [Cryobacterium luteum]|uniref:Uncharacterized protein n=1 Tax=Cryobacterium luteum TaxID=1424661 RepID=A0A1H8BZR5_9MICO|nr:hypothetical protein [Cryobacterium luteum]TFB89198.1 hypothetical protein E3O10_09960 [Cryobacterium luteum]SEM88421.1 hypothetical protein SAMN05216281_102184 [Cryobacterium luteum]
MQPADPGQPAMQPADDDRDEATRIVRRGSPRHGAAAPQPSISSESDDSSDSDDSSQPDDEAGLDDDTVIVQRTADERTVIVQREADERTRIVQRAGDEHTRRVARRPKAGGEPDRADDRADDNAVDNADDDNADDATVRSSRGSTAVDTLLSSRRAAAPAHTPVADALQRRYEPPQVQSGASVRYAARPTPAIVAPRAPLPVADPQPDVARLRLADAAAEIREHAAAVKRHRRRFTLVAIISITGVVVLAAAAYTVFTVLTW